MKNLSSGDKIKIKNKVGILTITLTSKLENRDVTKSFNGGLGHFDQLRFEIHECHGRKIFTFYDSLQNNEMFDTIYLALNVEDKDDLEFWVGTFPKGGEIEDNYFESWHYC